MRHFIVRAGKRPVELLEDLREHRGLFLALLLAKPTSGSQGAQNNPHPRGMLFFERRMGRRQFTKLLWKAISVQAPRGAGVLNVSGKAGGSPLGAWQRMGSCDHPAHTYRVMWRRLPRVDNRGVIKDRTVTLCGYAGAFGFMRAKRGWCRAAGSS
jgi:hypothetical protein